MLFGITSEEESAKRAPQYHGVLVALWLVSEALSYSHRDKNHKGDTTVISPPLLSFRILALEKISFPLCFALDVPVPVSLSEQICCTRNWEGTQDR